MLYVNIFTLNDITIPMGKNDSGGSTSGHSYVSGTESDMEYIGGSLIFCLFFSFCLFLYFNPYFLDTPLDNHFPLRRSKR